MLVLTSDLDWKVVDDKRVPLQEPCASITKARKASLASGAEMVVPRVEKVARVIGPQWFGHVPFPQLALIGHDKREDQQGLDFWVYTQQARTGGPEKDVSGRIRYCVISLKWHYRR